jgi:hypothetical protein
MNNFEFKLIKGKTLIKLIESHNVLGVIDSVSISMHNIDNLIRSL